MPVSPDIAATPLPYAHYMLQRAADTLLRRMRADAAASRAIRRYCRLLTLPRFRHIDSPFFFAMITLMLFIFAIIATIARFAALSFAAFDAISRC